MNQFSGVEHVGGNMFESVPRGDAIFMKVTLLSSVRILHLLFSLRAVITIWALRSSGFFTVGATSSA